MNKTCDFICSALCGGGISYLIGYTWFLLGDINTLNAIMILAGLVWFSIGTIVALIASVVWTVRHVRVHVTIK